MDFFDKSMWRVLNIFSLMCFGLLIVYFHFFEIGEYLFIPSILTVFLFIYLIIKPTCFSVFGFMCIFWGLFYIFFSGALFGFLLFILGIVFLAKGNFFKTKKQIKIIILGSLLILSVASAYQSGFKNGLTISLEIFGTVFLFVLMSILYEEKLQNFRNIRKKPMSTFSDFTDIEILIAESLILRKHYSEIAQEMSVSESTIKRSVQKMYEKIRAKNKLDFIKKYKEFKTLTKN